MTGKPWSKAVKHRFHTVEERKLAATSTATSSNSRNSKQKTARPK
jgi:hypothetical protein